MRFVNDYQKVRRKIIQKRSRRIAGLPSCQVARIVFNPLTVPDFPKHLQIIPGPLLKTLSFQQLSPATQKGQPLFEFLLYTGNSPLHSLFICNEVSCRKDRYRLLFLQYFTGDCVQEQDTVDFIAKKLNSNHVFLICRDYLNSVSTDSKRPPGKPDVITHILDPHKIPEDLISVSLLPKLQRDCHIPVVFRRTETVYTGHACHYQNISSFQQGACSPMT